MNHNDEINAARAQLEQELRKNDAVQVAARLRVMASELCRQADRLRLLAVQLDHKEDQTDGT